MGKDFVTIAGFNSDEEIDIIDGDFCIYHDDIFDGGKYEGHVKFEHEELVFIPKDKKLRKQCLFTENGTQGIAYGWEDIQSDNKWIEFPNRLPQYPIMPDGYYLLGITEIIDRDYRKGIYQLNDVLARVWFVKEKRIYRFEIVNKEDVKTIEDIRKDKFGKYKGCNWHFWYEARLFHNPQFMDENYRKLEVKFLGRNYALLCDEDDKIFESAKIRRKEFLAWRRDYKERMKT